MSRLAVLKFGGSILSATGDLRTVAETIRGTRDAGYRVLAVVSALFGRTDALQTRALTISPRPDPTPLAALLATGEQAAAALLTLQLRSRGVSTTLLDVARVGPFTRGPRLDATPTRLDAAAIRALLRRRRVAVLPGFVGRCGDGRLSLLGRGGSDLTALFAASRLEADRCILFKDVAGVFERDPRSADGPPPQRFARLSWADAAAMGAVVLQPKAMRYARRNRVRFRVHGLDGRGGTEVGAAPSLLEGIPGVATGPRPGDPLSAVARARVHDVVPSGPLACADNDAARPREGAPCR